MLYPDHESQNKVTESCDNCNSHVSVQRLHHPRRLQMSFTDLSIPQANGNESTSYGYHPKARVAMQSPPFSNDISSRFGLRLRDLRRSKRMTQVDMAVTFGIDRSYISDVECGKKGVSLATLEVIALGLNIELSDLLKNL